VDALEPWHVVVLVVVVLLLFGARRLPELAKSVAESVKIFRNEMKDPADDGH
jgi:sec-independent protein translocase protein TatA